VGRNHTDVRPTTQGYILIPAPRGEQEHMLCGRETRHSFSKNLFSDYRISQLFIGLNRKTQMMNRKIVYHASDTRDFSSSAPMLWTCFVSSACGITWSPKTAS
jgi:hypothetical protein